MALDRFVSAEARIQDLAAGFGIGGGRSASWGRGCDGPFWMAESECLAFSDVGNHRRLTWSPDRGLAVLGGETNRTMGATRDGLGRIVSCEWATGRVTRQEHDGTVTLVAAAYHRKRLNRPDDVVVGAGGSILFTDRRDPFTDIREPFAVPQDHSVPTPGLYRVPPDLGSIELLYDDFDDPGGLALAPDEATLYLSDSRRGQILALAVDADGRPDPSSARILATIEGPGVGAPFGLTVNVDGNIFCGGPGGIWILDASGEHMATLRHPASKTTNLAWGGDDWTTLFFTTAVGLGCIETRTRGIPLPAAPPGASAGGASRPLWIDRRVERHHRDLDRIITPGTEVVELASGGLVDDLGGGASYRFGCTLEGPAWVEDGGYLFFSDIGNDRRMKWAPGEGVSVLHQPTNHANGATLDAAGRIVACEHATRRVTRRDQDGTITVVADQWEGRRLSRPNDVVVSSDGAVYFTAPWWDFGSGERREIEFNGVFRVSPDLATVAPVIRDFEFPNGLCFSPDESVLYVNDTRRHHIRAFDVLPDGALDLESDRIFAELGGDAPGAPDGMKVDVEGNLYCGGSGGLWILNPSGAHLGTIVHGAAQTTNLAFGGPEWKTLFFVSWVSLGCVDVEVPGMPVPSRAIQPVTARTAPRRPR